MSSLLTHLPAELLRRILILSGSSTLPQICRVCWTLSADKWTRMLWLLEHLRGRSPRRIYRRALYFRFRNIHDILTQLEKELHIASLSNVLGGLKTPTWLCPLPPLDNLAAPYTVPKEHKSLLTYIIGHGIDAVTDARPLMMACTARREDLIRLFLAAGSFPTRPVPELAMSPIQFAIRVDDTGMLGILLQREGWNTGIKEYYDWRSGAISQAMDTAVAQSRFNIVKTLITDYKAVPSLNMAVRATMAAR